MAEDFTEWGIPDFLRLTAEQREAGRNRSVATPRHVKNEIPPSPEQRPSHPDASARASNGNKE